MKIINENNPKNRGSCRANAIHMTIDRSSLWPPDAAVTHDNFHFIQLNFRNGGKAEKKEE